MHVQVLRAMTLGTALPGQKIPGHIGRAMPKVKKGYFCWCHPGRYPRHCVRCLKRGEPGVWPEQRLYKSYTNETGLCKEGTTAEVPKKISTLTSTTSRAWRYVQLSGF